MTTRELVLMSNGTIVDKIWGDEWYPPTNYGFVVESEIYKNKKEKTEALKTLKDSPWFDDDDYI